MKANTPAQLHLPDLGIPAHKDPPRTYLLSTLWPFASISGRGTLE